MVKVGAFSVSHARYNRLTCISNPEFSAVWEVVQVFLFLKRTHVPHPGLVTQPESLSRYLFKYS